MKSQEDTIQELRERIVSLRRYIEQNDSLRKKYLVIANILRAVDDILSKHPIDTKKLSGETLGIIKILDGPLHNHFEEELFELAGDIGLMVRMLKQEQ